MRRDHGGRKIAAMNHCNPFTVKDDHATLFARLLIAGTLCFGFTAPAGWAETPPAPAQDLRSPDARDAALAAEKRRSTNARCSINAWPGIEQLTRGPDA